MNADPKFVGFSQEEGIRLAQRFAGANFSPEMKTVLQVALSDFRNMPNLRIRNFRGTTFQFYIERWVTSYLKGLSNRPSVKHGQESNTNSDPLVSIILAARVPKLTAENIRMIEVGHSTLMTIENLVGELLEEYLSLRLHSLGWCCAWGSTLDAVDFCKSDGSLLQIKNSDNSENSSSSQVRIGRPIEKWFRRFSTKRDTFNWSALRRLIPGASVSEDDFRDFVKKTISSNPRSIHLPLHAF